MWFEYKMSSITGSRNFKIAQQFLEFLKKFWGIFFAAKERGGGWNELQPEMIFSHLQKPFNIIFGQ